MSKLVIFFISFGFAALTLATSRFHGRLTVDRAIGIQNVHPTRSLRVGGIPILLGMIACVLFSDELKLNSETTHFIQSLLIAISPAFLLGLAEDITNVVPPSFRLCAAVLSGYLCLEIVGVFITHTGLDLLDNLLQGRLMMTLLTIALVAAYINAFNIIDGANGLSIGIALTQVLAFGFIASKFGDDVILGTCWCFGLVMAGYLIFNWPIGKIFLGDCGAYLIGMCVICIGLYSSLRNPQLPLMHILLILFYPTLELTVSIVRRIACWKSPFKADNKHAHSFVFNYLFQKPYFKGSWLMASNLTGSLLVTLNAIFTIFVIISIIY